MAYTLDLGSSASGMRVQVPPLVCRSFFLSLKIVLRFFEVFDKPLMSLLNFFDAANDNRLFLRCRFFCRLPNLIRDDETLKTCLSARAANAVE